MHMGRWSGCVALRRQRVWQLLVSASPPQSTSTANPTRRSHLTPPTSTRPCRRPRSVWWLPAAAPPTRRPARSLWTLTSCTASASAPATTTPRCRVSGAAAAAGGSLQRTPAARGARLHAQHRCTADPTPCTPRHEHNTHHHRYHICHTYHQYHTDKRAHPALLPRSHGDLRELQGLVPCPVCGREPDTHAIHAALHLPHLRRRQGGWVCGRASRVRRARRPLGARAASPRARRLPAPVQRSGPRCMRLAGFPPPTPAHTPP